MDIFSGLNIEDCSEVAYKLGPFFFSILFMLVIVGMAHRCYKKVNLRSDPVASPDEKRTYRFYLLSSIIAGIALAFISVGWWIYSNTVRHTMIGSIVGLERDQQIIPINDDLYMKVIQRDVEGVQLVDKHFVIVKDGPFSSSHRIEFRFYNQNGFKERPNPESLYAVYSGRGEKKFKLIKDDLKYSLKEIN